MPSAISSGASAPARRSRPGATKRMSPARRGSTTTAIGSSVSGHGSKSGAPLPPATRRLPAASWAYSAWPQPWTGSSSRTEPRDSQALDHEKIAPLVDGARSLLRRRAADRHHQRHGGIDLLRWPLLRGVEVAAPIRLADNVAQTPLQHRIAIVPEPAGAHGSIEL